MMVRKLLEVKPLSSNRVDRVNRTSLPKRALGSLAGGYWLLATITLLILPFLSGCKKISYDIGKLEKTGEAPKYTVEVQPNLSPAEGGVQKPTN